MAYLVLFAPEPEGSWYVVLPVLVSAGLMLFALVRYFIRFVQVVSTVENDEIPAE